MLIYKMKANEMIVVDEMTIDKMIAGQNGSIPNDCIENDKLPTNCF
jgi:hypothetical protein